MCYYTSFDEEGSRHVVKLIEQEIESLKSSLLYKRRATGSSKSNSPLFGIGIGDPMKCQNKGNKAAVKSSTK